MMCSIEGCNKPSRALSYCQMHYRRHKLYGNANTTLVAPKYSTAIEKLKFHGWIVTKFGCWEWSGSKDKDGYGKIGHARKSFRAHRVAYETWVGPIPAGMVVRHKVCDNPPCINPEHLDVGTVGDNNLDIKEHGRFTYMRGADHHAARLTKQDALDIRIEYANGLLTQAMLAETYGVTKSLISRVTRGDSYA